MITTLISSEIVVHVKMMAFYISIALIAQYKTVNIIFRLVFRYNKLLASNLIVFRTRDSCVEIIENFYRVPFVSILIRVGVQCPAQSGLRFSEIIYRSCT